MGLLRRFRKKHRYKRNDYILLISPYLTILTLLLFVLTVSKPWLDSNLTYFHVSNGERPFYSESKDFDCLIILDDDTIFHQLISYKPDTINYFSFEKKITQGKHILKVYNLKFNVSTVDTLQVKTAFLEDNIYIRNLNTHMGKVEAERLNIAKYGKRYKQINNANLFKPEQRVIDIFRESRY